MPLRARTGRRTRWIALATALFTLPGLTQLPAFASPQSQRVALDLPEQLSGSADGLPHLVDTAVTQETGAKTGPGADLERPKDALPPDLEQRGRPAKIPQTKTEATLPLVLSREALAAAQCARSPWRMMNHYEPGDIVSYQGRDWEAIDPWPYVPPSEPDWEDLGPCAPYQASPPDIVEMSPVAGEMVASVRPVLTALAESTADTEEWGALRYAFRVDSVIDTENPWEEDEEEGYLGRPQCSGLQTGGEADRPA